MAIFLSALVAAALARAAMPDATAKFARQNPLTVFLILTGILAWAWYSSGAYAERIRRQRPGQILARNQVVPDEHLLRKEKRFIKNRMRHSTRDDEKDETRAAHNLESARNQLDREGLTPKNRARIQSKVEETLRATDRVRLRGERLAQLDEALRRFDLHWFRKTHSINFGQLTPQQQQALQTSLLEERRRVNAEEEIEKLQLETSLHVKAMEEYIAKCRECLRTGNAAGAQGWLNESINEQRKARELEQRILDWENRLIRLTKRELRELDSAE